MTLWRAGPLSFDLGALTAPPDWSTGPASFVSTPYPAFVVDVDPTPPSQDGDEPTAGELVTRSVAGDVVTQERPGGFVSVADFATHSVRYRGAVDVDGDKQCPIFESFLRVLSAGALLRHGGALMHASSVAVDGASYVFCGLSGAGKTTLVEGTADGVYLSDDQSIVSFDDGAFVAWGTPFSGSARRRAAPISAPLAALVVLDSVRPARTSLERLPKSRARDVLRHVCAHERTAAEAARALSFVSELAARAPLFSLARHIDTPLATIIDGIRTTTPTTTTSTATRRAAA